MTERSAKDYYDEPTEYGGKGGDNRRTPDGRVLPGSVKQQAQDLRREGIRGQDSWPRRDRGR